MGGGGLGVVVVGPRSLREEEEGRPWPRACWAGFRMVLVLSGALGAPRGGYACPFVSASPDLLLLLPFVRGAGTEVGAKEWEGVIGEGIPGVWGIGDVRVSAMGSRETENEEAEAEADCGTGGGCEEVEMGWADGPAVAREGISSRDGLRA